MRVYIPFDDGSAVAYDGKNFIIHKQPVDMDTDLRFMPESAAEYAWRARRKDLVKALESAWWREKIHRQERATKKVYSREDVTQFPADANLK